MKKIRILKHFIVALFFLTIATRIVPTDHNSDISYICFDEKLSTIKKVIDDVCTLDTDLNSPVHALKAHIENGFIYGLYDEVVNVLDYADWFINQQPDTEYKYEISTHLDQVITQVINGELNAPQEYVLRSHNLPLWTVDKRIIVQGKSQFKSDVIVDHKLRVHGKARFYEDVEFKDEVTFEDDVVFEGDVIIEGTLSVSDVVIDNLTVENLTVVSCMDSLCVNDLTASDLVVDNLTVLNCMDSLCVNNLTILDLVADNITVDNLTVLSCMDSLCVNDLSVIDESISGTLSVQEEVVGCDLTVGCNINMNDSINSAIGNVNKGTIRFIHNYGTNNTFVGKAAGNFTLTGTDNAGFGFAALNGVTSGNQNTAVGARTLQNNTTGLNNVAVGFSSGVLATGSSNTFINGGNAIVAGDSNTFINGGDAIVTGDNNIMIGNPGVVGDVNTIRIGLEPGHTACYVGGIVGQFIGSTAFEVYIKSDGQLGMLSSSAQFKRNIENMTVESNRIYDLNPVKFMYKEDTTDVLQYGLIAEEVARVFPELVIYKDGTPMSVRYNVLPVLLLNELQKLAARVEALEQTINT